MRTFVGTRVNGDATVWVVEHGKRVAPLPPRFDLRNHSPDGFEWGYAGSGPAQLSLALCAAVLGDTVAQSIYQQFKSRWTQCQSRDENSEWTLSEEQVKEIARPLIVERARDIARGNVERHIEVDYSLSEAELVDTIYDEAYTLAFDALHDAGVDNETARTVAQEVAQSYAQP